MHDPVSPLDEMQRVLRPLMLECRAEERWQGLELAHWRHDALCDWTRPMRDHVLMAYRDTPRRIVRTREGGRRASVTDNDSVTIIPAGQTAHWDIEAGLDVIHVYVPTVLLDAILDRNGTGSRTGLNDAVAEFDPTLSHLIRLLNDQNNLQAGLDRLYADTLTEFICLHVARRSIGSEAERRHGSTLAPWRLRSACDLMLDDLASTPSLAELAGEVGLSPKFFCRAFRDAMGAAPHAWLRATRMAEAKRRLAQTPAPVIEIALSLGYADQTAFGAAFKREVGVPPAKWRKSNRHLSAERPTPKL